MKNSVNLILFISILALAISIIVRPKQSDVNVLSEINTQEKSPMPVANAKSLPQPSMLIDQKKAYSVILHTTLGDITIELDAKNTPITANNFYYLAKEGFYDNVIFHRVIPGFMVQSGDPTGTGTGGPGYRFNDEPFTGEYKRGTVAMANAGPNTNGSQFFIMHADLALQPAYVIFGRVTSGLEVVDQIANAKTIQDGYENSRPETPIVIKSVTIKE